MQISKANGPIIWLTNLRVIATLAVILIHSAANLLLSFHRVPDILWWNANVYNGCMRFAVPIFVMLTGALVLGKEEPYGAFVSKSFQRIVVPFLFWNIFFVYFNWAVRLRGKAFQSVEELIRWIGQQYFTGGSYHFWYVYMVIGLYLFIPIISTWIRQASERQIQYFLGIWLLTILFNNSHFPVLDSPVPLPYFTGYLGYLVLGYYLRHQEFKNLKQIRFWAIALFLIGTAWTLIGTYQLSLRDGKFYGLLYANFSPSVVLSTAGLFLLCKYFPFEIRVLIPLREWISSHSYGIYLVHILVLFYIAKIGIHYKLVHPSLGIPVTAFSCLFISGAIVWLLRKIPGGAKVSG